jgi:hypothetical protein
MELFIALVSIVVFPLVIGYIYGGNGYEPPLYAEMGRE